MRRAVLAAFQGNRSVEGNSESRRSDADLLLEFSALRDEAAFGELVERHGPLVQGVCRRILGDVHDAEDAFQAVFLVLARKSASIRRPELLANWLYGVACRIARKARVRAMRKVIRERQAAKMPKQEQLLDLEWAELKRVLDDELSQLPEKYRAPLVLCYLRGQTNAQAAAQLGWPVGSMSERLARAREMLRRRLNRRGLNLSAGLLAVLLSQKAASAGVSPLLVEATVKAGMAYAANTTAAGSASSAVLELADESSRPAIFRYLKTLILAFIIAVVVVALWPQMQALAALSRSFLPGSVLDASGAGMASTSAGGAASASAGGGHCCSCPGP